MNVKIQQVFANESQAFFSERLRWKSDAQQEIETQNQRISKVTMHTDKLIS